MKRLLAVLLCSILLLSGCAESTGNGESSDGSTYERLLSESIDSGKEIRLYENIMGHTVIDFDFPFSEMPSLLEKNGYENATLSLDIIIGNYNFWVFEYDSPLTPTTYMFFKEFYMNLSDPEEEVNGGYSVSDDSISFFAKDKEVADYIRGYSEAVVRYTVKTADDKLIYGNETPYRAKISITDTGVSPMDKKDISKITLHELYDVPYTGEPVTQELSLWLNGAQLYESRDYDVVYENNTEVGTASLKIVGTDRYTGELTADFRILPPTPELTITEEGDNIRLTWTETESTDGYELYYAPIETAHESYELIAELPYGENEYVFGGADLSTTVFFRVCAVKNVDSEKYSGYPDTQMIQK